MPLLVSVPSETFELRLAADNSYIIVSQETGKDTTEAVSGAASYAPVPPSEEGAQQHHPQPPPTMELCADVLTEEAENALRDEMGAKSCMSQKRSFRRLYGGNVEVPAPLPKSSIIVKSSSLTHPHPPSSDGSSARDSTPGLDNTEGDVPLSAASPCSTAFRRSRGPVVRMMDDMPIVRGSIDYGDGDAGHVEEPDTNDTTIKEE